VVYFLVESIFMAVSLWAMPVSVVAAPGAGAPVLVAAVSAGMAPDSEPVPPVVAPVSLFGGLHAASPKAVRAANRNVDERFMVSLPWAAPRGTTVEVNFSHPTDLQIQAAKLTSTEDAGCDARHVGP
jgi:hypothetical protein